MQNSSPILRCKFLARKGAKFIANFSVLARKGAKFIAKFSASATNVMSLPSHSLSHRAHLTHNVGSASALPIINPEYFVRTQFSYAGDPRPFVRMKFLFSR